MTPDLYPVASYRRRNDVKVVLPPRDQWKERFSAPESPFLPPPLGAFPSI